jgi:hypothetical protein
LPQVIQPKKRKLFRDGEQEAEFVLETDDVVRPVVGHLRGEAIRGGAAVIDHVDDARVPVTESLRLLDRRYRGHRLARRSIDRVGRVLGERRQSTLFRRVG